MNLNRITTTFCLGLLAFGSKASLVAAAPAPADLTADWQSGNAAGVYARHEGDYVRIGNEFLERVFRVSDDVVRTVELVNKVSGTEPFVLDQPELALEVSGKVEGELDAPDFKLLDVKVGEKADGQVNVSFHLECRRNPALELTEEIEAYPHRRYQRKWLTAEWKGEGDVIVQRVDVEKISFGWFYVGRPWHFGSGQPVFVGDLYLGLEYPGADTGVSGSTYLRHYPGQSAKGGWKSRPAIWGVAQDQAHVREAFFSDYLATIAPAAPKPFVLYNFLEAGPPAEKKLLPWIDRIGRDARTAGFALDSFVLDDGWQDRTTVWRPDHLLFPRGFAPLARSAASCGGHLGLWMSLDGYELDTHWGDLRGLEVTRIIDPSGRYCLAGRNYGARLRETLRSYVIEQGVNYFKFDYNNFACDVPTHGHPVGRPGRDAQIDAYIEILKYVKALSPRVHIAITTGIWLSPWWTLYADWVWLGGKDTGSKVPSLTAHDSAMTYRDTVVYDDFVTQGYVFPFSGLMTHGFWTPRGTLFPQFKDDCMLTIGRGITDWEILTSPEEMNPQRYAFLGRAIQWGKANWDVLSHTAMILGDPAKGEVYGYSHVANGAAIVILRNPGLQSQTINLPWKTAGVPAAKAKEGFFSAFETYPTRTPMDGLSDSGVSIDVLGAQTKVLVFVWDRQLEHRLEF